MVGLCVLCGFYYLVSLLLGLSLCHNQKEKDMALQLELAENGASFALRDAKEDGVNRLLFKSDPKQPLALNLFRAAREAAIVGMYDAVRTNCACKEDELPEVKFHRTHRVSCDGDYKGVFCAEGVSIDEDGKLWLSGNFEGQVDEITYVPIENVDTYDIIVLT